ncbi:hypothetical protein DITRI_Ditri08aG0113000 [Diplodiscus trichospermus]
MFEYVSGLNSAANINGCILADDMGLGKTLESITLLCTILRQGFEGKPMVKKAIIVTPTCRVSNWESEIKKWVGERVQLIALCESSRDDVVSVIDSFTSPHSSLQVLIVSYETYRMHSSKFSQSESCDLLICDEAHRLKNDQTITTRALAAFPCKRRILLSGTPMQNDLEEFFSMVNFTNPGILGDAAYFRRYYEFISRRTNALLSNHLPPKIVEVVCCKLTPLQSELNEPSLKKQRKQRYWLILQLLRSSAIIQSSFIEVEVQELQDLRTVCAFSHQRCSEEARLLAHLHQRTDNRIVLVSNYTQTLDLFAQLCRERRYPYLRLDGTTSISKRQKLVNGFNDSTRAAARVWRNGQKKRVYIYRFLSTGTTEEKVYQRQMSKEGLQKVIQQEQEVDSLMGQGNVFSTEDLRDLFTFYDHVRSEIHEKMTCNHCENCDTESENVRDQEKCESENGSSGSDQEVFDISGFAGIAGCLDKLKTSEKQYQYIISF